MRIENVEGIVWDLDGTLLDSFGIFADVIEEIVHEQGRELPSREFQALHFHGSLEESVQGVLGIGSAHELAQTVELFLARQERHYEGDLDAHLFNDATMLAQQAAQKGIKQLLVTNRAHEGRGNASPRAIVAATVLADCIHEIHAFDEVEFRKPDRRAVKDWVVDGSLHPNNLLVIGDQHIDAQLAINLGARALIVSRNGDIPHLETVGRATEQLLIVSSLHDIILN